MGWQRPKWIPQCKLHSPGLSRCCYCTQIILSCCFMLSRFKAVQRNLLLRQIHCGLKNEKITHSSSFFICVIDAGRDIFSCNVCKKRACAALRGTSTLSNLIGWGKAPEYQLPVCMRACVCVSAHVCLLVGLFVKACILSSTSVRACTFAEAARHKRIRRSSAAPRTYLADCLLVG